MEIGLSIFIFRSQLCAEQKDSVVLKDDVLWMCQKLLEFSIEIWESLQRVHFILLVYLAPLFIIYLY